MARTAIEHLTLPSLPELPAGVPSYRDEIADAVARIARRFHPVRIILFGSRAYGHPHPESDVDLMVVMETPLSPSEQAAQIRQEIGRPFPLDIHVRTPVRIRLGLREHDFFIEDVMRGITVYEGNVMSFNDEGPQETVGEGQPASLKNATREWLTKSNDDARAASQLLAAQPPLNDFACFAAQRSVETALKALLQEREIPPSRTHDLVELARLAASVVPGLMDHKADLEWLSGCAIEPRYPGRNINDDEARRSVQIMSDVRAIVLAALEPETGPPE